MNFYFLLEDEKSFLKVLPHWLEYMDFKYKRVIDIKAVTDNSYVLQSGQGVTQLVTKVLFDTIDTIVLNPGKIDKLIVILDAEQLDAEDRKREVLNAIESKYGKESFDFEIVILVSNHCFETWLLGCMGLYPEGVVDKTSFFYEYYNHYNIEESNPEDMKPPVGSGETIAKYHFHYLHELLRYKKIRYSKNKPDNVSTRQYFDGIVERIKATNHEQSFREFYDFILSIK